MREHCDKNEKTASIVVSHKSIILRPGNNRASAQTTIRGSLICIQFPNKVKIYLAVRPRTLLQKGIFISFNNNLYSKVILTFSRLYQQTER